MNTLNNFKSWEGNFNNYFIQYFQRVNMTMVEEVTLRSTLVSAGLEEREEEEEGEGRRMERTIMEREPREERDSMATVEHTLRNQHLVKQYFSYFATMVFFPILSLKKNLSWVKITYKK